MKINTIRIATLGLIASAVAAGTAFASAPKSATITIRHETKGCHSWALKGGTWNAKQSVTLSRGATLTVIDDDVMPHMLVKVSGPKVQLVAPAMRMMAARAHVTFKTAGRYVFTTKPGEDYMKGVKTTGPDNVLKLVVVVR